MSLYNLMSVNKSVIGPLWTRIPGQKSSVIQPPLHVHSRSDGAYPQSGDQVEMFENDMRIV